MDEKLKRASDDYKSKPHVRALFAKQPRRFMRRYGLSKGMMLAMVMREQMLTPGFDGVVAVDSNILGD